LARNNKRDQRGAEGKGASKREIDTIYGFHAVRTALTAGRRDMLTLHVTTQAAERLTDVAKAAAVPLKIVTSDELTRRLGQQAVHQGVMLESRPLPAYGLEDIDVRSGLVLVLDQVTDPHNVGAIIRTAAAFAADAVITTTRHSPDMSGIVAKAASGGTEIVPLVEVVNLARALEALEDAGYLRVGFDSDGTSDFEAVPLRAPTALIFGAEGKGLRRLTRENCDVLARLDMPGQIKSLNVSNACAVALSVAHRKLHGNIVP
jgi:23S rRNA (guanosine2251-2'-O)-methyltransferase